MIGGEWKRAGGDQYSPLLVEFVPSAVTVADRPSAGHSANQLDYPKADIPDWSCDDVICVCGATMQGS